MYGRAYLQPLLLLLVVGVTAGCGSEETDVASLSGAQPMSGGEECHVCGMLIAEYPGPKGQAFERGQRRPRNFCSTRDLFAYLLQPETDAVVREVYVHDMAGAPWHSPQRGAMVDARQAWYVGGQPQRGAMGPTLASFATREAADAFAARFGGRLLRYKEITLEVIAGLDYGQGSHGATPAAAEELGDAQTDDAAQESNR